MNGRTEFKITSKPSNIISFLFCGFTGRALGFRGFPTLDRASWMLLRKLSLFSNSEKQRHSIRVDTNYVDRADLTTHQHRGWDNHKLGSQDLQHQDQGFPGLPWTAGTEKLSWSCCRMHAPLSCTAHPPPISYCQPAHECICDLDPSPNGWHIFVTVIHAKLDQKMILLLLTGLLSQK